MRTSTAPRTHAPTAGVVPAGTVPQPTDGPRGQKHENPWACPRETRKTLRLRAAPGGVADAGRTAHGVGVSEGSGCTWTRQREQATLWPEPNGMAGLDGCMSRPRPGLSRRGVVGDFFFIFNIPGKLILNLF